MRRKEIADFDDVLREFSGSYRGPYSCATHPERQPRILWMANKSK